MKRLTLIRLPEQIAGDVTRMLLLVSGAALLLLFAAAANVSSLFLARTAVLKPDAAVRLALGAAPRHLLAATLAESLTLSILGGIAGMLLGAAAVKLIVLRLGAQLSISRLDEAGLSAPAFGIIVLISVFLGGAAFVPSGVELMRWCKRRQIETELRAGSRALSNWGRRVRGGLVSLQICVAVILLAGTIFLSRGLISVRDQAFGPEYKGTIAMRIAIINSSHPSPDQWKQFYDALLHYVKGVPGVRSAGLSLNIPLEHGSVVEIHSPPGAGNYKGQAALEDVTPGYFHVLGIRLVSGGLFDDGPCGKRAVINESLAKLMGTDRSVLGRTISRKWRDSDYTIVGVVQDSHQSIFSRSALPTIYTCDPTNWFYLLVRGEVDERLLANAVIGYVKRVDKDVSVDRISSLEQLVLGSVGRLRLQVLLLQIFSLTGVVLTAFGVFATVSHSVARRSREFAVRLAVGARPSQIILLAMREIMTLALLGGCLGLCVVFILRRALAAMVYG